jgi:hypothetical protein
MNIIERVSKAGCGRCDVSRRQFLAGCTACAAGFAGVTGLKTRTAAAADRGAKTKVRLVFTHIPSTGPIWPNIGYDFDRQKKELIRGLRQGCPNIEFLPVTARNAADSQKILQDEEQVDGYLVYMLGLWTGAPQAIAAAGRPTLFVDDLYGGSGEFLIANAAARRAGQKVACVSSSRLQDVVDSARCFEILRQPGKSVDDCLAACQAARMKNTKPAGDMSCPDDPVQTVDPGECIKKLKSSTILVVGRDPGLVGKAIEGIFGTKVMGISFQELDGAYQQADRQQADQWADRWIREAEKVIEPSRADIRDSGAMYVAMRSLMKRHHAQAIAINCLGGFYGGHIKAYPCLGFCQMNNDGLVGACEADLRSTITMLTMSHLTGRPGYISDPVIDTSKNQIIYAHCVAPYKVFGPEGPSNPFHIRSHSEDRKGAAIRSLMPLGYMTTTLEVSLGRKQMIFHQGKSVENIDEDMACRTKLAAEVKGDVDKLMNYWDQWGWHRVTFYGDLKQPAQQIAKALRLEFIEEA